ncbi:MAG: 2-hydroxyacyl-CoA dehydratase family protein [Thermodesulfobacteriota bacterium]|nr:2-hydroxyacyl-CoA dehydratase family protein [Thermodesulfobacteriota bacterium]
MNVIKKMQKIVNQPDEYAKQWKAETGGKVVGTVCSYAPVEIIQAGGALPFRVFGNGGNVFSFADTHLQSYCCSLVRGILNQALAGDLDFLDGAVFTHTCDSMQRLSDIWRMNAGLGFHEDLVLPVKMEGNTAREYMIRILEALKTSLEGHLDVAITDERLGHAITTMNQVRTAILQLDQARITSPSTVSSGDLHMAIRAAMIMDPAQWLDMMADTLSGLTNTAGDNGPSPGKRVILSGAVNGSRGIHDFIEEKGGAVVHDDMCTGIRYAHGLVDESMPPIPAITDRYMHRVNCPSKHTGIYARGEHLVETARATHADGVIFLLLKFCDPHAFDYPYLKTMLDDASVPSILLEVEDPFVFGGQAATRVEAFLEML